MRGLFSKRLRLETTLVLILNVIKCILSLFEKLLGKTFNIPMWFSLVEIANATMKKYKLQRDLGHWRIAG